MPVRAGIVYAPTTASSLPPLQLRVTAVIYASRGMTYQLVTPQLHVNPRAHTEPKAGPRKERVGGRMTATRGRHRARHLLNGG